ncbi:phage major tail tube protein [Neorhizobium sp. T786]|uniref:phage major tail tube protein n=1 Tax=Pseudorhizobium xiangyangii TaxID=2883104 RepID=UPI001D0004C2|nr:phage major tail tube protein [Neorhizobium xiangyangii]MCB5203954.1 phage major tail tube protein [Neorhizobium xiangyangii]
MDRIIRGANWYCQQTNQRQRADETTLPALTREMISMVMGGGYFAMEMPAEIQPLTCEMTVNGVHEDLKARFGREPGDWTELRYYENLLNVFPADTNGEVPTSGAPKLTGRVVFLKGLLNGFEQGGVKGMKSSGATRLRWSSIVLYHDIFNGRTVHKFDVQNNELIIDGVNYTAEHNRIIAA